MSDPQPQPNNMEWINGVPAPKKQQPLPIAPPYSVFRGLRLTTLPDMETFARYAIASGYVPKSMTHISQAVMAMQLGAELGLSHVIALNSIAVFNGRPTLYGDAMLALCQRSPAFDHSKFKEWFTGTPHTDEWTAHCQACRIGGIPVTHSFSVADAKRAGLWNKRGKNDYPTPWVTFPARMMQQRARAFALRDGFADILCGLHSREELIGVDELLSQIDLGDESTKAERVVNTVKAKMAQAMPEPVVEPAQPTEAATEAPAVASAPPPQETPADEPPFETGTPPEDVPPIDRDALWGRFTELRPKLTDEQRNELAARLNTSLITRKVLDARLTDEQFRDLVIEVQAMVKGI